MTTAVVAVTLPEIERMAQYVVESGLFGIKTVPQATALMLLCQAKGMHPMEAVEEYHIIQGRHSMKSERMLAKFQQAGGRMQWVTLTDDTGEATFSHPQAGSVQIKWTIEMAKRAGLAGKDNWRNYPRAMLRSRVISEGVRSTFPGATGGAYTPEEADDIPAQSERDVTPPPEKPATGVALLKQKLAPPVEPPPAEQIDKVTGEIEPAADLAAVLARIEDCGDDEALTAAADLARALPTEQQIVARKAYRIRKAALHEAAEAATRG